MTDLRDTRAPDGDVVAKLLRSAGRRMDPPAAAYERVLNAATAAWQQQVRRRRRRRVILALAASLAFIFVATVFIHYGRSPEVTLMAGRTERVIGAVRVKTSSGAWTLLSGNPTELLDQTQVHTGSNSRVGIKLGGGASLRLAEQTDVVLLSDTRVNLIAGKLYVDTPSGGFQPNATPIEIITPAGSAIDVGTQFEIQYRDSAYRLRVREGRVRLSSKARSLEGAAGEQILIDSSGHIEHSPLEVGPGDWQWIQALAPAPDIEGQPLMTLLTWVSRETGRSIQFENRQIERKAQTIILHGNIHLLEPLDALTVMLATTDLQHVLMAEHTILIKARAPLP